MNIRDQVLGRSMRRMIAVAADPTPSRCASTQRASCGWRPCSPPRCRWPRVSSEMEEQALEGLLLLPASGRGLLHRSLSKSPHAARFVLKGALMLRVWDAPMARPTKDIDLLGRIESSLENLSMVVREVCALEVAPDGLDFRPATVRSERIREDADYEGIRIRFDGILARTRIARFLLPVARAHLAVGNFKMNW